MDDDWGYSHFRKPPNGPNDVETPYETLVSGGMLNIRRMGSLSIQFSRNRGVEPQFRKMNVEVKPSTNRKSKSQTKYKYIYIIYIHIYIYIYIYVYIYKYT